jgi:hypothetical protein
VQSFYKQMKLTVVKSSAKGKKYTAIFSEDGHEKKVHFGSAGMDDFTLTHDVEQRERYRERHKKDLDTGDPKRAGFLSYYLLWGSSTSLQKNIQDYKRRFHFT